MIDKALDILEKLESLGYKAYIVGGFVRDYILGIKSNDIDICTNAKPKELLKIFQNAKIPKEDYGSVIIDYNNYHFEITTFRREKKYIDNRKPIEIEYIDDLDTDLLRRDFTVNTLCMDKNKNIIDLLNGRKDIENKLIKTVGESNNKFSEDALRILRAIRFATKLNFRLDDSIINAITKNKDLLKNISYERKKEELDKIFMCTNNKLGIKMLLDLKLEDALEIENLKNITYTDDLLAIWTILDVEDKYHFTSNEKSNQHLLRKCLKEDILDPYNLFNYGLYISSLAAGIKGISIDEVNRLYNKLKIHSKSDIDISVDKIINILKIEPGPIINQILSALEKEIIYGNILNTSSEIEKYILNNYS